ncbi:MAG: hypothetical protein V1924_03885 [Candidatus Bathyarchaeota archaeon]
MSGSGNSKLVRRLILASLAAAALFSAVVVLGSNSTQYGVQHIVDIKPGSTSFSESFTFTVGPLSSWRNHVLEFRCDYTHYSSVENAASPHIAIKAVLTVNGAEAEGFTHYIDAFRGGFGDTYDLALPSNLLRVGENQVTLTLHIEVDGQIDPASDIKLVYSGYQIKTS